MQVKNLLMYVIDINYNVRWHNIKLADLNILWGKKTIKTFLGSQKNPTKGEKIRVKKEILSDLP